MQRTWGRAVCVGVCEHLLLHYILALTRFLQLFRSGTEEEYTECEALLEDLAEREEGMLQEPIVPKEVKEQNEAGVQIRAKAMGGPGKHAKDKVPYMAAI